MEETLNFAPNRDVDETLVQSGILSPLPSLEAGTNR